MLEVTNTPRSFPFDVSGMKRRSFYLIFYRLVKMPVKTCASCFLCHFTSFSLFPLFLLKSATQKDKIAPRTNSRNRIRRSISLWLVSPPLIWTIVVCPTLWTMAPPPPDASPRLKSIDQAVLISRSSSFRNSPRPMVSLSNVISVWRSHWVGSSREKSSRLLSYQRAHVAAFHSVSPAPAACCLLATSAAS